MAKLPLFDMSGKSLGDLDLKDEVFGADYNQALIHQIYCGILANRRHGTHDTKTRGEVRGGGRKPWRQKGTGMARHGSRRSPIWKGGGITWGPHPHKYTQSLPKKMRREALRSALSQRVRESAVSAVSELKMDEFKTKKIIAMLQAIVKDSGESTKTRTLLLLDAPNKMIEKSAANIPGVTVVLAGNVNVVDVVLNHKVLATSQALKKIEEVLS